MIGKGDIQLFGLGASSQFELQETVCSCKAGRATRGGSLPWRARVYQTLDDLRRAGLALLRGIRGAATKQDDGVQGIDINASGEGLETPVLRKPRLSESSSPTTRISGRAEKLNVAFGVKRHG